jgi:hypothetical protein
VGAEEPQGRPAGCADDGILQQMRSPCSFVQGYEEKDKQASGRGMRDALDGCHPEEPNPTVA